MNFLEKIQKLPRTQRKIILWLAIIIITLILLFFWAKNFQTTLKKFKIEEFKKELNFPKLEIPKIQ